MHEFEIVPRGPFSLDAARDFAGGFPAGIGGGGVGVASITLAFPVEGTESSVAAELWQDPDGVVRGRTDAPAELLPALVRQASRSLSLDHDGSGWPAVGERDPLLGELQRRGCGLADGLPGADELGKDVIRDLYGTDAVTGADVERMAEAWRPYRMWAVVLLRMAWTRRSGGEVSYRR